MWRHTHLGCFVRELHHTAERALLANPHHIIFAFLEWLCLPAHYMCIEVDRLLWIPGQLLIPNEPSVIHSHIRHLILLADMLNVKKHKLEPTYQSYQQKEQ